MAQLPTVPDEWYPLAPSQFLTAASSTALTIPATPAGQPSKGAVYVATLMCMFAQMWIRYDGSTAFASTGAEVMYEGDWVVVYGYEALKAIRIVKDPSVAGTMAIKYFYFRKTP